jgi:hypothetical protein
MVEEKKKPAVKKAAASTVVADSEVKVKKVAAKKAPAAKEAETAVWPFPEVEKAVDAEVAPAVAKKPAKVAAKAKSVATQEVAQPSAQERYRMVETAAYYISERYGFQGCSADHWAEAELEIANKLAGI